MYPELGSTFRKGRPTRSAHLALRGLLLWICLGPVICEETARAKKTKASPSSAAIETLFDGVQPAIRECALTHAIYKGATVVELHATIMVSRDGRVFSAQVTSDLTPAAEAKKSEPLQTCVANSLRQMKFPASSDTFRKLLRNWKFATA